MYIFGLDDSLTLQGDVQLELTPYEYNNKIKRIKSIKKVINKMFET